MMVRGRTGRAPLLVALSIFAVLLGAAKCIEHESLYVDSEGYMHIVGVMTNETDVSATTVTLRGQLFDASGNVYAETSTLLCPTAVQPHSQNAFEMRFSQPHLPAPARFEVRPISGQTIDEPLPAPNVRFASTAAYRVQGTLAVSGSVVNDSVDAYADVMYCAAAYDHSGNVVMMQWSPLPGTPLAPGASLRLPIVWPDLPPSATTLVVWLSVGSQVQWIVTPSLPIQNSAPPR